MIVFKLETPVKIYSNAEYGNRLIFVNGPTNPRDELGKIGITFHNIFTRLFFNTVAIEFDFIDEYNKKSRRLFYVNRNSLIKYLMAYDPHFSAVTKNNDDLINSLKQNLWPLDQLNTNTPEIARKQGEWGEKTLRHAGTHNKRPLASWLTAASDFIRGKFFSWFYQKTVKNLSRFFLRFFFVNKEKDYFEISEVLAKRRFHEAAASVPAYQRHLNQHPLTQNSVFHQIPVTSKDNYIKTNMTQDWELHQGGTYPERHKTDTSTGTTGKPTAWVRSYGEMETVKKSLKIMAKIEFKQRPLEYINAFALGPWATGMTTYELMRSTGSVFAVGPDKEKILDKLESTYAYQQAQVSGAVASFIAGNKKLQGEHDNLQELINRIVDDLLNHNTTVTPIKIKKYAKYSQYFSGLTKIAVQLSQKKPQAIVAGYPPFLKDLIDYANSKGIDFNKYQARAVVGGQAISEALRGKLIEGGFTHVNSSYGASDLDINLGVETNYEVNLRRTIEKNPGLARELFGNNKGLPMVFSYDPFNYHIEVQKDDELIFTCNRDDRSSPRIRYDLGDKGRVYAVSDVEALLVKYGIFNLKAKVNLPLLFVWGREADINYNGAKVSFTDLERAVTTVDKTECSLKRAFYSYEDQKGKEQFEIWIELKDNVPLLDEQASQAFLEDVLANMAESNQDFRWQLEKLDIGAELPRIRFFMRNQSPMQDADGHRKQVLIFKNGVNLAQNYQAPNNDEAVCRSSTIQKTERLRMMK